MNLIALATFLSAFLLFLIQPLLAKELLPVFGGSAAVWGICLFFFQTVLLLGYAYAHWLATKISSSWAPRIHLCLIAAALLNGPRFLEAPQVSASGSPEVNLLLALLSQAGLPYFLLSTTGPLLQSWFHQRYPQASVYRLYALSNIGSFGGLLTYPFLLEPWLSTPQQKIWFSAGFIVLCLALSSLALMVAKNSDPKPDCSMEGERENWLAWLGLPALASLLLVSLTAHICHDLVSVPLLWIAPLALYLLSFVVCFERPQLYKRGLFFGLYLLLTLAVTDSQIAGVNAKVWIAVPVALLLVFVASVICHGELAARKPSPKQLTRFYLAIAAGGAIGSLLASILAPIVLPSYFEMHLGLAALAIVIAKLAIGGSALSANPAKAKMQATIVRVGAALVVIALSVHAYRSSSGALVLRRNFYGVLRVADYRHKEQPAFRGEYHGRILHGMQFLDANERLRVAAYYAEPSGVFRALASLSGPRNIGIVGLGVGNLAGLGRAGDTITFYELNPAVIDLAYSHFSFLSESPATVKTILGDARTTLSNSQSQAFDALIVDAFNGDAIPAHLLTLEAIKLYMTHLKTNGILLIHISNRHLNLLPVLAPATQAHKLALRYIVNSADKSKGIFESEWVALASSEAPLQFADDSKIDLSTVKSVRWTDDHSSIVQVFK